MKYSVETIGEGDPVIFLPAGGFKGNEGLIIADYLKDSFKTYLLDLPGYGASEGIQGRINTQAVADWLKGFLDEADIACVTLIGHSIGGALALMFALHYPDRVNRLILLDQGHKKFPNIPFAEFGKFALLLPLLNLGVSLIKRPLLIRLLPFLRHQQ
ncbi:alpha/beta fold hydrolase [Macrococcus equipercicus]|uniref:alpha/beta fold hydrolase n=1 Tax=Macrococcus equipercicus TaxID=69967 RepID=UPI0014796CA3|nr:alpha/beta fold hydrolase [Macrococcus equipercicus]